MQRMFKQTEETQPEVRHRQVFEDVVDPEKLLVVPSSRFPTVASAVEAACPGTLIQVQWGHRSWWLWGRSETILVRRFKKFVTLFQGFGTIIIWAFKMRNLSQNRCSLIGQTPKVTCFSWLDQLSSTWAEP